MVISIENINNAGIYNRKVISGRSLYTTQVEPWFLTSIIIRDGGKVHIIIIL